MTHPKPFGEGEGIEAGTGQLLLVATISIARSKDYFAPKMEQVAQAVKKYQVYAALTGNNCSAVCVQL